MKTGISQLCEAVRHEDIDGWLFYGFQHRDPLSDNLLCIDSKTVNTRRWFYILLPEPDNCIKICHAIEAAVLDHLPGRKTVYTSQEELKHHLLELTGLTLAAQISSELPSISFLDCGTADLFRTAGVKLASSSVLLQKTYGILDDAGIESHNRAATHLYEIVDLARSFLQESFAKERPVFEGDVQNLILDEFSRRNLITNHNPIVATGKNSSDPHYSPQKQGSEICRKQILQLDLWAKEPAGIFADISWVFYTWNKVPGTAEKVFSHVCMARDLAVSIAGNGLAGGSISGFDVDAGVRGFLEKTKEKKYKILHRTGHSIDTETHGSGVNLDSIEFPDHRPILPGSCFSVEPGLYGPSFGMRTEINCFVDLNGKLNISGGPIQHQIECL